MRPTAVYDTGMLIGLARNSPRARAEHQAIVSHARPIVPGPVLAQAWRGKRETAPVLAGYLRACAVHVDYSEQDYKRVGVMLGRVSLPGKKRPDVVDAIVALTAARHDPAAVLTSDPSDIAAYLDVLPKARNVIVPV
jgi:predicted nucleic acid-binding protein